MWQRFTEKARRVVWHATDEAHKNGDSLVSTEHLLLGLCREPDSNAAAVLTTCGVTVDSLREEVHRWLVLGKALPDDEVRLTPAGKSALDHSYQEARTLHNDYIGTEHLLLGLIQEERGIAAWVLESLGVDIRKARIAVKEIQDNQASQ